MVVEDKQMVSKVWRNNAMFCVVFFLILSLFTAFIVIPKLNDTFEAQHLEDVRIELELEVELFRRFVDSQKRVLDDLAKFSSLSSAVMLSDASAPGVTDLFDNIIIEGVKGRLILQNIAGDILLQTVDDTHGEYNSDNKWLARIFDGDISYYFELLNQNNNVFTFQISVPVMYNGYPEGALSAEITVPIDRVFVAVSSDMKSALRLSQGSVNVQTDIDGIEVPRESYIDLDNPELRFVYITDDQPMLERERLLSNTIFTVLLVSLLVSFIIFAFLGYFYVANKDDDKRVAASSWRIYIFPAFIGVIGISATIAAYLLVNNMQLASLEQEQIATARSKVQAIREKVDDNLEILDSVTAFYNASTFVDREEFKQFTAPLLKNHRDIQALEWVPSVPYSARAEYEKRARDDGLSGFTFTDKNEKGEIIPALKHDHYYPVFYVEPFEGNEAVLGLAPSYTAKRRAAIYAARDTGEKVAAAPIRLAQEREDQAGYLIFDSVYNGASSYLSQKKRRENINGFTLLVLRVGSLLASVSGDLDDGVDFYIEDITETQNPEAIFGKKLTGNVFSLGEDVDVAGRTWRVEVSVLSENSVQWVAWFVLISGSIFSIIVTLGLIHLVRRREVLEGVVEQRTKELEQLVGRLTDSNEELERFAFVCSHDLQEPLRMIYSFSQKLQKHIAGDLAKDEKGQEYFRFVIDGATRAQKLIADILAYSRVDSDASLLEDVSIEALLRAINENMLVTLEERGGGITYDKLPVIRGNRAQLFQLFQNLINNGIKYQKSDNAPYVNVSYEEIGGFWKFSVKDNGIGMDERYLTKIFEIFQRLHHNSQYTGSGIGLSICKKIVERYGGSIWVESEEGAGSTFHFTISKFS